MAKRSTGKRPTPLPRRAPLVGAVGSAALAASLLGCGPKKTQGKPPQAVGDDQYNVAPQVAPPPQVEEQPPPMVPDENPPQPAPQPGPIPPMVPQPPQVQKTSPPPMVPQRQKAPQVKRAPQVAPREGMEFPADPPPLVGPFDGMAPPRKR